MKLTPLADRVILKMVEVEETTKGGIILTASAKEKPSVAEVISVGPGGMVDGHDVVMTVKPGDKVITSKYSGTSVCKSTRPPTICPIITGSTTQIPPAFSLMAAGPISLRSARRTRRASANGILRPSITPTPTVPMGTAGCTSRGATRRFTTARTG